MFIGFEDLDTQQGLVRKVRQMLKAERFGSSGASQELDLLEGLQDLRAGQSESAVKLFGHVVAIGEQTLPETHPSRLASQHELARACMANGDNKRAAEILEQVVAIRKQTLPETHPSRLASQHELAPANMAKSRLVLTQGVGQQHSFDDETCSNTSGPPPSIVSENFSEASVVSTSASSFADLSIALEQLVAFLLQDPELYALCNDAMQDASIGPIRFISNYRRLLKNFGAHLRKEADTPNKKAVSALIRSRAHHLASTTEARLEGEERPLNDDPGTMASLQQDRLTEANMERLLVQSTGETAGDPSLPKSAHISGALYQHSSASLASSESSSQDSQQEEFLHLQAVKQFMLDSAAYAHLKETLKSFVHPGSHRADNAPHADYSSRSWTLGLLWNMQQVFQTPLAWLNLVRSAIRKVGKLSMNSIVMAGFNLAQCDAPLKPNQIGVKWTCTCGETFAVVYDRSESDTAAKTLRTLLRSGYKACIQGTQCSGSNLEEPIDGGDRQSTHSNHESVSNRAQTSTPKHLSSPLPDSKLLGRSGIAKPEAREFRLSEPEWLLLCFRFREYAREVVHEEVERDHSDLELIKSVKNKYQATRGRFSTYVPWRSITRINFVKFRLWPDPDYNKDLAELSEDWAPPSGWKDSPDSENWVPCPGDDRPITDTEFLLHLWDRQHDSSLSQIATGINLVIQNVHRWSAKIRKQALQGLRTTLDEYRTQSDPENAQSLNQHEPSAIASEETGSAEKANESVEAEVPDSSQHPACLIYRTSPKRLKVRLKADSRAFSYGWGITFEEGLKLPWSIRWLFWINLFSWVIGILVFCLVRSRSAGYPVFTILNSMIGAWALIIGCVKLTGS